MSDTDALYLDRQRLIPIALAGTSAARRIEYRKEVDDQTRIVETGADFGSATFVVNTKGGLRIDFDVIAAQPAQPADKDRGDIRFADGSVLLRA